MINRQKIVNFKEIFKYIVDKNRFIEGKKLIDNIYVI